MTHTYKISGMTCTGCQAKVQGLLSKVSGVKNVSIDLAKGEAGIEMDKHIATVDLKVALKDYPKYQLSETQPQQVITPIAVIEENKSWITIYKPILLIFGYIIGITLLVEYLNNDFNWMRCPSGCGPTSRTRRRCTRLKVAPTAP